MLRNLCIPIQDNKEPLEILSSQDFVLEPIYFNWGKSDSDKMELRSGAIIQLKKAQKILRQNPGCEKWTFKIWDPYRSIKVQKRLCDDLYNDLKNAHPDWSEEKLMGGVMDFLALPSTDSSKPAPHNTGGTVDLTIVDENGQEVPMGTGFDDFTEKSHTNYFANSTDEEERLFHKNRMLLKTSMEAADFVNDPSGFEWWHYGYGTPEWAYVKGKEYAIYGSVEL
jgi:D-alanyl-D-alanine dipeptidase